MSKKEYRGYIGIDVSKKHLDVCVRSTGEIFRVENNVAGFKELKKGLKGHKKSLIAMEATGGYELEIANVLQEFGFCIAVVNPRQVRDFAKATGRLAKTDRIDASLIAYFAEALRPMEKEKTNEAEIELKAKKQRREQLVDILVSEKNRLQQATKFTKKYIQKTIKFLEEQLADLEKSLYEIIDNNDQWSIKNRLLQTVKGVGKNTAAALITSLPELGKATHKEIAALAGIAPYNQDSGNYKGKRRIWGERSEVRKALFMATLVAVKFNAPLKTFYEKLCKLGKKKMVALVACMRKLLITLNAMLKNNTAWSPKIIPIKS